MATSENTYRSKIVRCKKCRAPTETDRCMFCVDNHGTYIDYLEKCKLCDCYTYDGRCQPGLENGTCTTCGKNTMKGVCQQGHQNRICNGCYRFLGEIKYYEYEGHRCSMCGIHANLATCPNGHDGSRCSQCGFAIAFNRCINGHDVMHEVD